MYVLILLRYFDLPVKNHKINSNSFTSFLLFLYLIDKPTEKEEKLNDAHYISSLVKKARKKDALAMRALYDSHARQMMAASQRITNSKIDSEDILQESFIQSFQNLTQLKIDEQYGGWLKRIVINKSLQWIKKRPHFVELVEIHNSISEDEDNDFYKSVSFAEIKKAMLNLPDGCRVIFSLYLLEGYKHKEIAEELNISISNSKSQYRYALKLLREKLSRKVYE